MREVIQCIPNKIKEMPMVKWNLREIKLAEAEISHLVALREVYDASKPLSSKSIEGCLHTIIKTAVLIETGCNDQADYSGKSAKGPFKPQILQELI